MGGGKAPDKAVATRGQQTTGAGGTPHTPVPCPGQSPEASMPEGPPLISSGAVGTEGPSSQGQREPCAQTHGRAAVLPSWEFCEGLVFFFYVGREGNNKVLPLEAAKFFPELTDSENTS